MSARAIAIHGNEMSGERRANLEIMSECPALFNTARTWFSTSFLYVYFTLECVNNNCYFVMINSVNHYQHLKPRYLRALMCVYVAA